MRFELYRVTIFRDHRRVTSFVLASDPQRAEEIVIANEIELNQENDGMTVDRVDDTLLEDQRLGLDALLECAPAGFVSFCPSVGWIAHAFPATKLRFYLIESGDGAVAQVIAPNADVAAAIWLSSLDLGDDGTHPMWTISTGLNHLEEQQRAEIERQLEFGPVGIAVFDPEEQRWIVS